jgi:ammonium transporter, Amt family
MFLDLVPAPPWLDSGHNAWQLVSATLVGLMSVPGLAILYAGLMKRKWAVNSSLMVLYGFGATLLVWSFWGYKMAFGSQLTDLLHFVGTPGTILSPSSEQGQAVGGWRCRGRSSRMLGRQSDHRSCRPWPQA